MSGAMIKISVQDEALRRSFTRLAEKDGGLFVVAMKNIGVLLVKRTLKRFETETGPDGKKWAPLNPAYAAGKKGNKILQGSGMRGGLMGTIVWQINGNQLIIGTNKIYGAVHQLGATIRPRTADALVFRMGGRLIHAKKVTIPARPYLGVSSDDQMAVLDLVEDIVEAEMNG